MLVESKTTLFFYDQHIPTMTNEPTYNYIIITILYIISIYMIISILCFEKYSTCWSVGLLVAVFASKFFKSSDYIHSFLIVGGYGGKSPENKKGVRDPTFVAPYPLLKRRDKCSVHRSITNAPFIANLQHCLVDLIEILRQ